MNQQLANVKIARFICLKATDIETAKLQNFIRVIGRSTTMAKHKHIPEYEVESVGDYGGEPSYQAIIDRCNGKLKRPPKDAIYEWEE